MEVQIGKLISYNGLQNTFNVADKVLQRSNQGYNRRTPSFNHGGNVIAAINSGLADSGDLYLFIIHKIYWEREYLTWMYH